MELVAESDTGIFTPSKKMYNNSNLNLSPSLAQLLCHFFSIIFLQFTAIKVTH